MFDNTGVGSHKFQESKGQRWIDLATWNLSFCNEPESISGWRGPDAGGPITPKAPSPGPGGGGGPVLTVESLLVHDGAAAQGLVVLLVAHERVHAQDSCGDMKGP